MLEIRPNCEHCDKDLEPASSEARICSYECTFCHDCVENTLKNVCPNCGGGFSPRPIRPSTEHRTGVSLAHQAAAEQRIRSKYSAEEISEFAAILSGTKPEDR